MSDTASPIRPRTGTRIEFRDVTKVFTNQKKTETRAVDGVTLTVEPGEILGVIGYSGAGKSTLVRLINGLDSTTSGQLLLDGTDVVGLPESKLRSIRRGIGMIFQQFNLFHSRTAAGNIAYPLELAGMPKAERKKRVAELLDFVGLSDKGNNYPEQLSGGQKQRVGIARALATNRAPPRRRGHLRARPETTHDVLQPPAGDQPRPGHHHRRHHPRDGRGRAIADKVAVMEAGKVVEYGSVYEVFSPRRPRSPSASSPPLRNTPDLVEAEDLLAHDGRLFTINLTEDSGFFHRRSRREDGLASASSTAA